MQSEITEKRRYKRLLFSTQEKVSARIMKNSHPDVIIPVFVLNMSEGGLGLASAKNMPCTISANEEVNLISIESGIDLSFLTGRKLKVRWLLQNPMLDHVCFACEFIDLSPSHIKMIRRVVAEG